MKKKLVLLALWCVCALSTMAGERSFLQITFASGAEAVIFGSGNIAFNQSYDPQKQIFLLSINQTTYEFSDLKELRFLDKAAGIGSAELEKEQLSFRLYDKCVIVSGGDLSGIMAYTVDGKAVQTSINRSDDSVTVDFSSCVPGIYIVKTKVNSIKVCIR